MDLNNHRKYFLDSFLIKCVHTLWTKERLIKFYEKWLRENDDYWITQLLKVYRQLPKYHEILHDLLYLTIRQKNIAITHRLILDGTKNSTDSMFLCYSQHKPLEEAIRSNSYEIVSMVLYYSGYGHIFDNGLTPFINSLYTPNVEIQKLLIDYEDDFTPNFTRISPLFVAIAEKSPLILEIIDRGADLNFFDGHQNVISYSLQSGVSPDILKLLWDKFDYEVWKNTFSKCTLLLFLTYNFYRHIPYTLCVSYIKIFMENEEKLRMIIEHHNNSVFKETDSIVNYLYSQCTLWGVPEATKQSYVLHLLSHGSLLFTRDLDLIYQLKPDLNSDFLNMLLYMDIKKHNVHYSKFSPLYFSYNITPDLHSFFEQVCPHFVEYFDYTDCVQQVIYARQFFNFSNATKHFILDIYNEDSNLEKILSNTQSFPSLTQLARDKTRKVIIKHFNISNSCQFLTHVNNLNISQHLKNIILFKTKIYSHS